MYDVLDKMPETVAAAAPAAPAVTWQPATRVAFRFFAAYFTLYIVSTQMIGSLLGVPNLASVPPLSTLVTWVATRVFGFSAPLVILSGSGDKPFDWALAASLLAIAAMVTVAWSIVDRSRRHYQRLHARVHWLVRLAVGATMIGYGVAKAIPLQMPFPGLTRLLEPYGHFSLMGVLWAQVGSSPAFERFTGIVELAAGILLFIPGLSLLGAGMSLVVSSFIFVLNMTYDVPVKLFSLHLVAMSLFLMAPHYSRLTNVFILNRPADPRKDVPLAGPVTHRVLVGLQLAIGAWLVFSSFSGSVESRARFGSAAPKPPLYGIWDIASMTIDGHVRSPLTTDYDRWRRAVIPAANALSFQRMDDTFVPYRTTIDTAARTLTLLKAPAPGIPGQSPGPNAGQLSFEQPSPDRVTLDGTIEGRTIRMELQRVDHTRFRLLQSRFRWVQDYPFNR